MNDNALEPTIIDRFQPGYRIGDQYEVIGLIGTGGSAVVYHVRQISTGKSLALKILRTNRTAGTRRFAREFRVLQQLAHPNIVAVHNYGQWQGFHFIAMQLVTGTSIGRRFRQDRLEARENGRPFPERILTGYLLQICDALSHFHRRGVVHRDIKPQNILISDDGLVTVMDFGIAGDVLGEDRRLLSRRLIGTLSYMSPEQVLGLPLDARSDLFSLGTLVYEMVTDIRPFREKSYLDTAQRIVTHDPDPPQRTAPDLSPEFASLLMRLLSKQPEARYQTALELKSALEALERSKPAWPVPVDLTGRRFNTPRLVGQDDILHPMSGIMDQVISGIPRIVVISGGPGAGKSRLLADIRGQCRLRGAVAVGSHFLPQQGGPYSAFREAWVSLSPMLDKLAERFTAEWVQERTAVIDEFLGTREDVETSDNRSPGDFIGTVLTEDARERFFEAFTEMLLRMTQVWTVVLLFDDADSGDEESLRLLKHLVRVVFERRGLRKRGKREISLLIVLGYDTRAIAQNRLMKNFLISLRGDHLDQFQVRPLQDKEISSLVVSMLGHPLDPPGLAELVQQSQGNPLLAVQTLHRWIDSDRLLPGPDALQLILEEDSSPTVVLVEDKLRNLLARRISDLPEVENLLLGAAAILGGRFAPEHLAMIADTASDRVPGMLESWIARGLVIEQWDDVHGRELYRLAHASLGSELIQRMSPAERARLNLRAADFIVRGVIKVPRGAMPAILLQHYRGAGRFEQAIHQALEAGRIARRQLLQDRALAAFSIGMAMWEDLTQSRREALRTVAYELCHEQALTLSSLGRCAEAREIIKPPLENAMMRQDLFWQARFEDALYAFDRYQGRFRQALQHLQHILELLNQLGDEHGVVRTLNNIGAISTFRGKIREAHLYLQEAEQRAQRLKDFALNADILLNLGKLYSISADYPKALSTLEQALLLYDRLGIKEPRYNILSTISSIYLQNGQLRRACDSFKELASQCRANGTPRDLGLSLINLAVSRASLGDVRPGLKDIRAANDIFLRLGDDARLAITSLNQAFSLLELSRFPQVARALRRTRLHAKRAGVSHALALADLAEAQMHSYQARYQQALECCNRSLKRQTALGQRSHLVETLLWTARIEEAQGLDRQAEDHLGAAHRAALDGCNQVTYAQLLVWRGFRQVRSDHPSEGFALLKDGADRLRNMEHSFQTAFSQSLLGLAQAWIGQPAEGLIQCGTAVTAAFNLDLPLAVALTNFYNCLCLVISGRWTELLRETSLHAEAAAQANIDDLTWRYGMLESRALEMLGQHREAVLRRQIAREILSRLNDGHPEIVNRAASAFWRIIQDAPARG